MVGHEKLLKTDSKEKCKIKGLRLVIMTTCHKVTPTSLHVDEI